MERMREIASVLHESVRWKPECMTLAMSTTESFHWHFRGILQLCLWSYCYYCTHPFWARELKDLNPRLFLAECRKIRLCEEATGKMRTVVLRICGPYSGLKCRCWCGRNPIRNPDLNLNPNLNPNSNPTLIYQLHDPQSYLRRPNWGSIFSCCVLCLLGRSISVKFRIFPVKFSFLGEMNLIIFFTVSAKQLDIETASKTGRVTVTSESCTHMCA